MKKSRTVLLMAMAGQEMGLILGAKKGLARHSVFVRAFVEEAKTSSTKEKKGYSILLSIVIFVVVVFF